MSDFLHEQQKGNRNLAMFVCLTAIDVAGDVHRQAKAGDTYGILDSRFAEALASALP
jgi:hypothetical protein